MKANESFTGTGLATSTEPSIFSDGETGHPQAWAGNKEAVISAHIPFPSIPGMPLLLADH